MAERQRGEHLNFIAYFNSPLFRQGPRETRRFYLWRYALMGFAAPELFFPLHDRTWDAPPPGLKKGKKPCPDISLLRLLQTHKLFKTGKTEYDITMALMRDGPFGQKATKRIDDEFEPILREASAFVKAVWNRAQLVRNENTYDTTLNDVKQMVANRFYKMPNPINNDAASPFMTFLECASRYFDATDRKRDVRGEQT